MSLRDTAFELVNTIPAGKVMSYGALGEILGISGWAVGRYLTGLPKNMWDRVMWQRVVAKNGHISSMKLGFRGLLQKELLVKEGVIIEGDTVNMVMHSINSEQLTKLQTQVPTSQPQ